MLRGEGSCIWVVTREWCASSVATSTYLDLTFRLLATSAIYKELYQNDGGQCPATFQIFYWIGWKPDPSQPQPLTPQKSDVSLRDIYRLDQVVKEKLDEKEPKT